LRLGAVRRSAASGAANGRERPPRIPQSGWTHCNLTRPPRRNSTSGASSWIPIARCACPARSPTSLPPLLCPGVKQTPQIVAWRRALITSDSGDSNGSSPSNARAPRLSAPRWHRCRHEYSWQHRWLAVTPAALACLPRIFIMAFRRTSAVVAEPARSSSRAITAREGELMPESRRQHTMVSPAAFQNQSPPAAPHRRAAKPSGPGSDGDRTMPFPRSFADAPQAVRFRATAPCEIAALQGWTWSLRSLRDHVGMRPSALLFSWLRLGYGTSWCIFVLGRKARITRRVHRRPHHLRCSFPTSRVSKSVGGTRAHQFVDKLLRQSQVCLPDLRQLPFSSSSTASAKSAETASRPHWQRAMFLSARPASRTPRNRRDHHRYPNRPAYLYQYPRIIWSGAPFRCCSTLFPPCMSYPPVMETSGDNFCHSGGVVSPVAIGHRSAEMGANGTNRTRSASVLSSHMPTRWLWHSRKRDIGHLSPNPVATRPSVRVLFGWKPQNGRW